MVSKKYPIHTLLMLLVSLFLFGAGPALAATPTIDVWYGGTQQFGNIGNPQPYINILGAVTDPDIGDTITLSYTLNGGTPVYPPSPLGIGPDSRRLEQEGDFNIDIPVIELSTTQANLVVITAEDESGGQDVKTVTVQYAGDNQWPFPYTIDWGTETDIQDGAQIVDGIWFLEGGTVRTTIPGYDRLIAIGETDWSDYEVTVPITFQGEIVDSPGSGLILRWQGHGDDPLPGMQPKAGYNPLGAILWYRNNRLEIYGNNDIVLGTVSRTLQTGVTYIFKARVETVTGPKSIYSLKVWEQGQAEPPQWDLVREQSVDPLAGSVGLISHNRDASFGTVTVSPIISNAEITLGAGNTEATITWTTYENTDSRVDYGLTAGYGNIELDSAFVTDHSVQLTGLAPDTRYHIKITSEDIDGNPASTGDLAFFTGDSGIVSDDFSAATLDGMWTFDDGGDAAAGYALVGTGTDNAWVNISVPAGSEHQIDPSGIGVPHLLQAANDADFEVEVKFESDLSAPYQEQGILVKQDDSVYMRFELYSSATNTMLYVSSYDTGTETNHFNKSLGANNALDPPMYLRVMRASDQWTVSHSFDGTTWTVETPFTSALSVTGIGPYAGNAIGGGSPAHTASIDYFFNTDSPIDPEDSCVLAAPTITSTPLLAATVGQLYTYDVEATGCPLPTFSLTVPPAGMTIDAATGLIEWTPGAAGDVDVTVEASNSEGTAEQIFTITASEPPFASPSITSAPVTTAIVGQLYSYDVAATGYPEPIYSLDAWPIGMTIDAATGLIEWTPDTVDDYDVTVAATNSEGQDLQPYTITVTETVSSGIVSDDFSAATLDGMWTFDDGGDAAAGYALVGTGTDNAWVNISVPAGSEHQVHTSGIGAPHLLQAANDADFEVEAKFESDLSAPYQEQGILVKQDDSVYMRFELYSSAANTRLYVSSYDTGIETNHLDKSLGTNDVLDPPMYMRVMRAGDQWTVSHSFDGTTWTLETPFTSVLSVTGIGPYAGNAIGGGSPAHTASIDYFFNADSPIDPEDSCSVLTTPTITSTPVLAATVGQLYTYDVEATGCPLPTFSLTVPPAGMTIDAATGLIEWTPGAAGDVDVTVEASNSEGTAEQIFTITASEPPFASPSITSAPVTTAIVGQLYSYDVAATGYPEPIYSLDAWPIGMTIDAATGLIEWTPDTVDDYDVTVAATNSEGQDLQPYTITVTETVSSGIVSDDFSAATLDGMWTFDDGGDAAAGYALVGTGTDNAWVNISVPAGSEHQVHTSGIGAPHLLQAANDADFEVEAKFESDLSAPYQEQGILVKQDDSVYMRFELYSSAANTRLYVSSYDMGIETNHLDKSLGTNDVLDPPMYMRVMRAGDQWTVSHSFDGTNWTLETPFTSVLSVTGIGPYAGNAIGGGSPAHTASIDYFFNTDSPIDPEDPLTYTLTVDVVGSGSVTLDPAGGIYNEGTAVQLTAVAAGGWEFSGWSGGGLSGSTNPETIVMSANETVTATFTESPAAYWEDFEGYGAGADPVDWYDSAANSSMNEDNRLFKVFDLGGEKVFGTSSTAANIHSHYVGAGSDVFTAYEYTGRMMMTNASSGIGVTFYSQYPNTDDYYRLRRYSTGDFRIEPHGTTVTGDINTGVVPLPDEWYRFRIEVEDTGGQTEIRAKVWPDGTGEPADWQANAVDASPGRLMAGTIGLWSYSFGSKYWDDLTVTPLTPPQQYTLTVGTNGTGTGSVTLDPAGGTYNEGTAVQLTAVSDPGSGFDYWEGDLTGSINPETVVMDADKSVTAHFISVPTHTLTVNIVGGGSVTLDPAGGIYSVGTAVQLTAVADLGWVFVDWSGAEIDGSTNSVETITMDADKSVTAHFISVPTYTLTVDVVGSGSVTLDPAGGIYNEGTAVQLTAVAAGGWEFSGWSGGGLSGSTNPETIVMSANETVTATFTESPAAYWEDFEGYGAGADPVDWYDSAANSSMNEDNRLFKVFDLGGEKVFGTSSTAANIHSHYVGAGSDVFTAYEYTGRMMMTNASSGIGVTFYSQYPNTDDYYRLRRYSTGDFRIEPHGTTVTGDINTGVVPLPDEWYRFRIEVEDTGGQTEIRAKVWPDGTGEPADWQANAVDASPGRLMAGTIGLWSYSFGSKYWDDLTVTPLTPPQQYTLTVGTNGTGTGSVTLDPAGGTYNEGTAVQLTAVSDPGSGFDYWEGDLTGSINPETVVMDADKSVTAHFISVPTHTLTVNIDGGGSVTLDPAGGIYSVGTPVQLTAVADLGWVFVDWSGAEIDGSTNIVETITMDADKTVTAHFISVPTYTLTVDIVGAGSVALDPAGGIYNEGTAVQLTAVADSGWEFSGWSGGGLSGSTNPETVVMSANTTVTATFTESPAAYWEDFQGYGAGADPVDWYDSAANSSMSEDNSLFKVFELGGEKVFGTTSTAANIHSHYVGVGSDVFTAYEYTGRMMITSAQGGIGVTFYSQYPNTDDYYRLRRYSTGDFRIEPHGTTVTGDINTGVVPLPNVWYLFKIEVEDTGGQTEIRAKVWPDDGTAEPADWQANAVDASSGRLIAGTIGLWGYSLGSKYWDDLTVTPLTPPQQYALTVGTNGTGTGSVTLDPAGGTYNEGTAVQLTAVADPGSGFDSWEGDLTGSINPETVTMDADKAVTANFISVPTYTLAVNLDGGGSVTLDPAGGIYSVGTPVQLTAVADLGWVFVDWSGAEIDGSTNIVETVTMDADKTVTAHFISVPTYTLTVDIVGAGSVALDPAGGIYNEGTAVQLTAVADSGWEFSGWSGGGLSGSTNPETVVMSANTTVTATFTESPAAYWEDFQGYGAGADPVDWYDSAANSSMSEDNSLFKVFELGGEKVFGTTSTAANIHSHYVGVGSDVFTAYEYTGRMMITSAQGGIGVTFYSQYGPGGDDAYYRLRRYSTGDFRIEPHGTTVTGDINTGVVPLPNVWYLFKIEVEDTGGQTEIRAKVWPDDGTAEPADWQANAVDASSGRLIAGTIGLWGYSLGSKYWDDLTVTPLTPPQQYALTVGTNGTGTGSVTLDPAGGTYNEGTAVQLTAVADPGSGFDSWEGDLTGSINPETVTMDADKAVTANFISVPTYTLAVNLDGGGSVTLDPAGGIYSVGTPVQLTAVADLGWVFVDWSGAEIDGSTNIVETVTMDADKTVTAHFISVPTYTLTVDIVGAGSVALDPAGGIYNEGTAVQLTAVADSGWEFSGWSGGGLSGSTNPETVVMSANTTVTATFTALPPSVRVTEGQLVLYGFQEGSGVTVKDVSGVGTPLNLTVLDPSGISWLPGGGLAINAPTLISSAGAATKVIDAVKASGEITIEAWIAPANTTQDGPARIVTCSTDSYSRNFTLGQGGPGGASDAWDVRMRTTGTGLNGTPSLSTDSGTLSAVLTHVVYTRDSLGVAKIYVDGVEQIGRAEGGDFSNWDSGYALALGNELSGDRPWLGEYYLVAIFDRALSQSEVQQNFGGGPYLGAFISDDFNSCALNPTLWTFVNPFDAGSDGLSGAGSGEAVLQLTVPAGVTHTPWGVGGANEALRIMQPAADENFEIEAKFNTVPSSDVHDEGIVIEQDGQNWLRFDVFHNNGQLHAFAGSLIEGSTTTYFDVAVAAGPAVYLRVSRVGDQWTFWYSNDGASWSQLGSQYTQALIVNQVGVFAANPVVASAFTAEVDYFFNTAIPILPEDGDQITLTVDVTGQGTVSKGPDQTSYLCGDTVSLTATPDEGWVFLRWSGDLTGSDNPATINMDGEKVVVATFGTLNPNISVWYGLNQSFGQYGQPQNWVNIVGNVYDSEGVASLSYSLNGGAPVSLRMGADSRRLELPGDFNADLDIDDLLSGANTLELRATDNVGNPTFQIVTVNYQADTVWPQSYDINWSTLATPEEIQDVAQVVDGKWRLENGNVRTAEPGYDRLIAIGDMTWVDYEVTVPITLHTAPSSYGVGVLLRWEGHTDDPVVTSNPKSGYFPLGAILWYWSGRLEIYGNNGDILGRQTRTLLIGTTYWLKARVETVPGVGGFYSLKVWEDGQPEPASWDLTGQESLTDPQNGSLMLIAHEADASFGNVEIQPIIP